MKFRNFRLQVLLRLILMLVLIYAAYFIITAYPDFWLAFCWMVLFVILAFISLIRFVEKSNRELSNFLLAIQQNDFSNVYPETHQHSKTLHKAFNIITREFIKLRSEKESNFHFLKTVVEHSGVPLLAYDLKDKRIALINESARNLFKIPHLTKLVALTRINEDIVATIEQLEGDDKELIKTVIKGEVYHLSVVAKQLVLQAQVYKVVALHNINSELDQNEIESWQKLIRVLTHEIKNSVIPISTLTEVINQMVSDRQGRPTPLSDLDKEDEEDLRTSLQTIEKRSKGLVKFVASYGDLAKVPKPHLEDCDLTMLIRQIVDLETREAEKRGVTLETHLPSEQVTLRIDPQMIEQVLINIIKNALEALGDQRDGRIAIKLAGKGTFVVITVVDNGPGMSKDTLEHIFVPFYTTKEGGSGIGLSLSRQIIRAHKGSLKVTSQPDKGTEFTISL